MQLAEDPGLVPEKKGAWSVMSLVRVPTYEVFCDGKGSKCSHGDGSAGQFNYWSRKQVEEYLVNDGWKTKGRKWYCPNCAKERGL